ncbi:hypothetical protein LZ009_09425 [Ramlibacter sp. XY19]|uniref:hypothetical protein n=1 Tax=Ramlibacter paludis TaxID=2908000 RepID=UPI0023DC048D|nr:hypothetical protein [Ramlibacter paludis]MCG2593000.1 hypothetical protein [Ramlibacter paludis]
MDVPSQVELNRIRAASARAGANSGDVTVHWQSTFGLIVIEVRGGEVFVNGERVEPVRRDEGTVLAK